MHRLLTCISFFPAGLCRLLQTNQNKKLLKTTWWRLWRESSKVKILFMLTRHAMHSLDSFLRKLIPPLPFSVTSRHNLHSVLSMQRHLPMNKAVQTFSVSEAYFAPHFTIETLGYVSVEVHVFPPPPLPPFPIYMHKHGSLFVFSFPPPPAFCYIGVKNVKQKFIKYCGVWKRKNWKKKIIYSTYVWGLGTGDGWWVGGKRGCSSVLYYTD